MAGEYVEQRHGGYYVAGSRVSLDSIVHAFSRGGSPETIQASFPVLKLAQVYGAIAYYLDHQAVIDQYIEQRGREFEASAVPLSEANPDLWSQLERARQAMGDKRP